MRVNEIKELLKHLPGRTELLIIPNAEMENGKKLGTGIGYFDDEEKELVYLGNITIVEDIQNED
jgi:hypothetical protein